MDVPSLDDINFGKYKGKTLSELLKDRKYCVWLLKQDWFPVQYGYLYNRVKEYSPLNGFFNPFQNQDKTSTFIERYPYFSLLPVNELKIQLSENEKICYDFYLNTIETLKHKILSNKILGKNPFDIKAPSAWLKNFEQKTGLKREIFKDFLSSKELQNITAIMEDIKGAGGIEYKGGKSFLIAKKNSLEQEAFWEKILKNIYGSFISVQYKHENRFYDFINIKLNTLYECKLALKDYNQEQFEKYKKATGFQFIYLIGTDCVIDMNQKKIYTTVPEKYMSNYKTEKETTIREKKKLNFLEEIIPSFSVIHLTKIEDAFINKVPVILDETCLLESIVPPVSTKLEVVEQPVSTKLEVVEQPVSTKLEILRSVSTKLDMTKSDMSIDELLLANNDSVIPQNSSSVSRLLSVMALQSKRI